MMKMWCARLLRFFSVLAIISVNLNITSYAKSNDDIVVNTTTKQKNEIVEVVEEKQEEIKEEPVENIIQEQVVEVKEEPVQHKEEIQGNRISISNVLTRNLVKDETGEHFI